MDGRPTTLWLIRAGLGIAVAAIPFLFPHVHRLVAAGLVDTGAIILIVSLATYVIDAMARP